MTDTEIAPYRTDYWSPQCLAGRALTIAERRVLDLAADGLTDAQIGKRIGLSEDAVGSQIKRAAYKLGARSRGGAVAAAYKRGLLARVPRPAPSRRLTRRQFEVLALIAQGLSNEEIGVRLEISPSTVKVHVQTVCDRLDARGRANAVRRAIDAGVLPLVPKGSAS